MENHHGKNNGACRDDFCGIVRDDGGYDHRDGNYGNERKHFHGASGPLAKKLVDDEPERNRDNHDFHDRKEHRHHVYIHGRAEQQVGNRRRQNWGEQSVYAGHADGKRDIAFREVSDDIARGAARASTHENYACHQRGVKSKSF